MPSLLLISLRFLHLRLLPFTELRSFLATLPSLSLSCSSSGDAQSVYCILGPFSFTIPLPIFTAVIFCPPPKSISAPLGVAFKKRTFGFSFSFSRSENLSKNIRKKNIYIYKINKQNKK